MSMLDILLGKDLITKADAALAASEGARKDRVRSVLTRVLSAPVSDETLNEVLKVSSQTPAIRAIAELAGKNMISEALTKVADKLEG